MNQPLAAQPLTEELVAMKGDDILLEDIHQLAGAVQRASGQRVIETKILRDESSRQATSEYWLERARYYRGRNEYERERDTYRQALVALQARRDDADARRRFEVVSAFAFFLGYKHNAKDDKRELEALLTNELSSVPPETTYAFLIAKLLTRNELEVDELRDSLLTKRPSFVLRMLDGRRDWNKDEADLIEKTVQRDQVPPDLKERFWSGLESLARDPGSMRAYTLAAVMQDGKEWQRAIPLWRGYIEQASPTNWEGYKPDAIRNLFTAYCRTNQWQAAEKLLLAQQDVFWNVLPKSYAEVAIIAAEQNAIDDAMRLWRISTNLDRRNLESLPQLAQTKAKPHLLAMYSKMKQEDPQSTIPELALRLLQ
jgi:tetratricopeptide (TPR) repeat protein